MEKLAAYIQSQVNLLPDELTDILANFSKREIVKHGFVLKAGHIATDYFFVVSGGLRIYYERDNKQVTGWIALEGEFFTDLSSLKNQSPSRFNIPALEDSELPCIKHERMKKLYKQYPLRQKFGRSNFEGEFCVFISCSFKASYIAKTNEVPTLQLDTSFFGLSVAPRGIEPYIKRILNKEIPMRTVINSYITSKFSNYN